MRARGRCAPRRARGDLGRSFLFTRIAAPGDRPGRDRRPAHADRRRRARRLASPSPASTPQWRRWWRYYVLVGMLTSALPFLLFGYAALRPYRRHDGGDERHLADVGRAARGVVRERDSCASSIAGLALGVAGVALVTQPAAGGAMPSCRRGGARRRLLLWLVGRGACGAGRAARRRAAWRSARSSRRSPVRCRSSRFRRPRPCPAPLVVIEHAGARPGLRRGRLSAVLPPDRRHRRGRRADRDLPDPGIRRAVGRAVPWRSRSLPRSPARASSSPEPYWFSCSQELVFDELVRRLEVHLPELGGARVLTAREPLARQLDPQARLVERVRIEQHLAFAGRRIVMRMPSPPKPVGTGSM